MFLNPLLDILCCPDCRGALGSDASRELICQSCQRVFLQDRGILQMMPRTPKALPPAYADPDYQRMSAFFDDSSPYFTSGNSVFKAVHESAHRATYGWEQRWPASGWAIDVGCGQGYHWKYVPDRSRLIGFDIRLESLLKIRERFPDAILIQGNLLNLPFKSASIDRASSVYALEHIYYLEDALAEIARVLVAKAKFLVGLPCEGGLAWTLGRKLTSERTMSKRYNVDYRRYIALEHCNTAARVEKAMSFHFRQIERKLFPLPFLPLIGGNLTLSIAAEKI